MKKDAHSVDGSWPKASVVTIWKNIVVFVPKASYPFVQLLKDSYESRNYVHNTLTEVAPSPLLFLWAFTPFKQNKSFEDV